MPQLLNAQAELEVGTSWNTDEADEASALLGDAMDEGQVSVQQLVGTDRNTVLFMNAERRRDLEKELLRKLDLRMSFLVVIYILNYIDRNNISAARLRGFESDLHLKGQQYATLLSILYVGYILMQVPSNIFLNYMGRPSLYLSGCMAVWGFMSILTGATTNFAGAFIARFFLGFVEAPFFAGALFLLSKWYKRSELGQRTALLSCGSLLSNAFGSLIASGILDTMQGAMGQAAWRWLFFVEGSTTVCVAVCAIFILPDFPETSERWLSPEEQALAIHRMTEDGGVDNHDDVGDPQKMSGWMMAVTDGKVWWLALTLACMIISLSFQAYFPTLSETMGYNRTITLLLCAPPWLFATAVVFLVTRHSDRVKERFWHIAAPLMVGIVGFMISISTMNIAARYLSLFLMAQSYAGHVTYFAWVSNSIPRPPEKRAVALAIVNSFSQLGNITGSYVWQSAWGPTYIRSYMICIVASVSTIIMCYAFRQHLQSLNRRADKRGPEDRLVQKGYRYLL